MTPKFYVLIAGAAIVTMTSCKKEVAPQPATLDVELQSKNATTGIVQWSAGTANVAQFNFNSGAYSNNVQALKAVDLFAAPSVLGTMNIPAGTYAQTTFDVNLQTSTASALNLQGNFTDDNGNTVPITVDVTSANVDLKAINDATLTNGGNYKTTVFLDFGTVMQGISSADLTAAEQSGQVLISATSNPTLYTAILTNLQTSETVTIQPD